MNDTVTQTQTCEAPTVSLIGLGGCGVNTVRRVRGVVEKHLNFSISLDSSDANIQEGDNVMVIGNGIGGGKDRTTNAEEFRKRIPQLGTDALGDSDVYILVGSLSGATGGVALPLLIQELHTRNKQVIIAIVGETSDQKGTENTHAALKTINYITERDGIYLPTVIAQTTRRRSETDEYIRDQLASIIALLRLPTQEVDKMDRLNFLNASRTVKVESGMHMIYAIPEGYDSSEIEDLHDESVVADSMLSLGAVNDTGHVEYSDLAIRHARFSKDGRLSNTDTPITGVIIDVSTTLDKIIENIESRKKFFESSAKVKPKTTEARSKLRTDDSDEDIIV